MLLRKNPWSHHHTIQDQYYKYKQSKGALRSFQQFLVALWGKVDFALLETTSVWLTNGLPAQDTAEKTGLHFKQGWTTNTVLYIESQEKWSW